MGAHELYAAAALEGLVEAMQLAVTADVDIDEAAENGRRIRTYHMSAMMTDEAEHISERARAELNVDLGAGSIDEKEYGEVSLFFIDHAENTFAE